jgi:predicted nuclease of predicted toxin-antitoxin system
VSWQAIPNPKREEHSWLTRTFAKKARFLVDENLGTTVADILRALGWNARAADEVGLRGHSDEDVFAYAWRQSRIIVTQDRGYLNDRRFPPHRNPGLVILPNGSPNGEVFGRTMRAALDLVGPLAKLWVGSKIVVSEDGTISITSRNHDTGVMETDRYRLTAGEYAEMWRRDS